ncbi:MAG: hypothetical protein LW832_02775, partial [Parachlamydia sp.]|nr:hypothetical protein [Parachlamydia sp.]
MISFINGKLKELCDSHPVLHADSNKKDSRWPLLEHLLEKGLLGYLEYRLAHSLLDPDLVDERAALFICHLSLAAKEGHLCVQADEELKPSVEDLWPACENPAEMKQFILAGAAQLSPSQLSIDSEETPSTPLCKFNQLYYFQKNWFYETLFLDSFKRHTSHPPTIQLNEIAFKQQIQAMQQAGQLLHEQAEGILSAITSPFSIICGGPGTGKTYTAARLIQAFWNSLDPEQKKTCTIALAAPTGK